MQRPNMPNTAAELPDRYDADLLHLMVRDARSLYVYWEISDLRKKWAEKHFECDWQALPKIIRVYDTTYLYFNGHNANRHFDIETTPEANNWHIRGVQPGTTYAADFGTYTIHRQFVPFLRSNFVVTSRDAVPAPDEPGVELENFSAHAQAMRKGVCLNDESAAEEAAAETRRPRVAYPGPAPASALYPSS